jgi:uncharacterized protein YndB with AHSA1/START domain
MSAHGTYERIEGRMALRFTRRLRHPAEQVWAAITEPEGLARWFPCRVEGERRVGAQLRFVFPDGNPEVTDDGRGEVLVFDPPRSFWFRWDTEELRLDLEPTADGGCVLTFSDLMPDDFESGAARNAAGWHVCLDELETLLDGGPADAPTSEPTDTWRALYDEYVQRGLPHGAPIPGEADPAR